MTTTMTRSPRPTVTNPDNKPPPLWFISARQRPVTDQFKNNHRSACIQWQHVMFSEDLSDQVFARKLCASCPNFKACAVWALYSEECDTEFGICAGMDPDQRRRIREGRESFWDWRRKFNYTQRAAKAAQRKREHRGVKKSSEHRAETPLCLGCGSNHYVYRDRRVKRLNKQRYHCTSCGTYFLGEEDL